MEDEQKKVIKESQENWASDSDIDKEALDILANPEKLSEKKMDISDSKKLA